MLVFITAGVAALSYRLPVALAIVALLAIVVTSYRQTVKAYPRGGGSYIVARENLGTVPGLIAAAAILTDYVLTVAVSITGGDDRDHVRGSVARGPQGADRVLPGGAGDGGEPPRREGGGSPLRAPDLRFRGDRRRHDRDRAVAMPVRVPRGRHRQPAGRGGDGADRVPPPPGVLLGRVRAHRCRGRRRRRPGVPPAPGEERRRDARDHGPARERPVPRHHRAVRAPPRPDHGGDRAFALGPVADRRGDLRRRPVVHRPADLHGGHPDPRREHRVPGLPSPVVDPRARSVHAEPVPQPRRPPGVLERRDRPRRPGDLPDLALRRLAHGSDPALRDRGLHGVHAVAGGDGAPLVPDARRRLALASDPERGGRGRHGDRPRRRHDHEVLEGRLRGGDRRSRSS